MRNPLAVIGPERPSILPKYIPFERSATWRLAISGSGAASALGAATRAAAIAARIKVRRRTGRTIWGPASSLLQVFTNRQYFGGDVLGLRARFRSTAHLPVEGRGLKETVDIPARIAELRSVLVETRSNDLRKAIQGAIEDCRRKLAEVETTSA